MVKSRSVKINAKNAPDLGRDRAVEPLSPIFPAAVFPGFKNRAKITISGAWLLPIACVNSILSGKAFRYRYRYISVP